MLGEPALQLLAALAAALFASIAAARPVALVVLAAAFLVGLATPTVAEVLPATVFAAAALYLLRPHWVFVAPAAAGFCAGGWAALLGRQGLPLVFAAAAGIALVATALVLSRRARFAPALVRDEALLLVGVAALVMAVGAPIMTGWRSAVALAGGPLEGGAPRIGAGLMAVVAAAVLAGCGWSWWKRR